MKNKSILGILILAISIILIAAFYFYKSKAPTDQYEEVEIVYGDLIITTNATGTVKPENRLEIKPPIAGRAEEILIREGDVVRKGQVLAWISSTERAAILDAARSQGEKETRKWQDLYRPTPVISPIDGTIILKSIEVGQTFTNTDAILVLSNRLTVKAQVDETDIASIKIGQKAKILLDAYSDQPIEAQVGAIAFDATQVNNITTYLVDVLPFKAPDFMRSGMTANVIFFIDKKENKLLLPNAAIVLSEEGSSVLAKDINHSKPKMIPVQLGASDGKMTEVLQGLRNNDKVFVKKLDAQGKQMSSSPFSPSRRK